MGVCFVVMLGCLFLFWYFFFFDVYSSGIVRLFCFFFVICYRGLVAPSGFCGVSYIGYRCVVVLNLVGYRLWMFFFFDMLWAVVWVWF